MLDNHPIAIDAKRGDFIKFHPLAVIYYERMVDIADQIDKDELLTDQQSQKSCIIPQMFAGMFELLQYNIVAMAVMPERWKQR